MQQRAKAEAARAKLKFAKQEANLQRELFVLAAQKEASVVEAELNAMLEDVEDSASEGLSENHQERTMSYVKEQNLAVRTSELTPSQRSPAMPALSQPDHLGSLEPQQGQVNQMEPLPGQFTTTEPTLGQADISAPSGQRITNHKSTPVNPNATPFVPRTLASRLVNQPTQGQDENHGTTSELIMFLKKDLLMLRFSNFNDHPETYSLWKTSFRAVTSELDVSPLEESELLVKWLGPESSKIAQSIRTSNIGNHSRALVKIWERLDERYGAAEMVGASLKAKIGNFLKITVKDSNKFYNLYDILMEIEAVKQNPKYT